MIESLLVGILLAGIYSFCVQKWAFCSSPEASSIFRGALIVTAFLRLTAIGLIFFLLSERTALNISMVMLSFIIGVSLCLLYLIQKAIPMSDKAGDAQSQGRF